MSGKMCASSVEHAQSCLSWMGGRPERRACALFRPMKNTISGNEGRGFMKLLVAAESQKVVGVHLVGPECAEIIQVCPPACLPSSPRLAKGLVALLLL